jgi:hypothetical protein
MLYYDFRCFDDLWLEALVIMINIYSTLLLLLLSTLCFLGVEVSEVLFGVEQGWEMNRGINYQLINSRGITSIDSLRLTFMQCNNAKLIKC